MAKKVKKSKKSDIAKKKAKKAAVKKASLSRSAAKKPDKRMPVHGDPDHEILCKWSAADNEYQCKTVATGGDWETPSVSRAAPPAARAMGRPDKRMPVHGDPNHEILCKWSTENNEYQCKTVATGGDWP